MSVLASQPVLSARIVCDPSVMSGVPVVRGTRVPAMTILAYIEAGHTDREIFEDYPTLPLDGIEAVRTWAKDEHRQGSLHAQPGFARS